MAVLQRSDWYDLARSTSWTPSYVKEDAIFPPEHSGGAGIPPEKWASYDEPF